MYLLFISQFGPFTMRRKICHYTSNFCAPKTINKSHTHFTYTYMYRSIQRTDFSMHTVHSCSSHTLYNHHYRSTGGRLNVPPVKQQHSRFYYRPQRSCGQGNIFTGVCLSTGGVYLVPGWVYLVPGGRCT